MTESKEDGNEATAGDAAKAAALILPQDPVAPSDWLSSLHVGVTWKESVDFSEKKQKM